MEKSPKKVEFDPMAKDPAFLFYYQDFLVGTDHMNLEQRGAYITALCHQANRGSVRPPHMAAICESEVNYKVVMEKFKVDEKGEFFNEKLYLEIERRKIFTESRIANLSGSKVKNKRKKLSHMGTHKVTHMETETETETETENKVKRSKKFTPPTLEEVKEYCKQRGSHIDPEVFWSTYDSQGWIKKNGLSIQNWKSTIITWEKNEYGKQQSQRGLNSNVRTDRQRELDSIGEEVRNDV